MRESKEVKITIVTYTSLFAKDGLGTSTALPDHINTPNTEESVHIHPDGRTLYFASKGHLMQGGQIFM